MYNITFISTTHEEFGLANPDELCKIINNLDPQVVFLEALEDTYTDYEHHCFRYHGVEHKKLEIAALQKYAHLKKFNYVPVLERSLSNDFQKKYDIICEFPEMQRLIDEMIFLTNVQGFTFLNSPEVVKLHEQMLLVGSQLLNDHELDKRVHEDIDRYENEMLDNMYAFARENEFETAIFMCGSAHRKSMIEKIKNTNEKDFNLNWKIFGS